MKHKAVYIAGDHKVICDSCGLTYMRSDCSLNWRNYLQCEECYDVKQPQLNVRAVKEKISVDIVRPESENDADLTFGTGNLEDL